MFNFVTPINLHTSCITLASKFVPLFDKKHSGHPNIGTSSSARSLAIHVAFLSGTANTSGHFVNRSWNTTTYLFPFVVTGDSIMSTPHISNRRCTGMGCNKGQLTLPTTETMAHSGQFLQCDTASLYRVSHHQ